jgi:hypothetical protein
MTAATTYAQLLTETADYLARSDLTAVLPNFVKYAEVKMNNDLRLREMIATVNINPSSDNTYVALPTGFLELISFNDDTGNPLEEVDYEALEDYKYGAGSGRAELFSIGARIDFERTASDSLNFPMRYWKRLNLIVDTSNTVLDNYPQLYLYGTLLQATPYIRDQQMLQSWKMFYEEAVKEANYRSVKNTKSLRTEFNRRQSFNILKGR